MDHTIIYTIGPKFIIYTLKDQNSIHNLRFLSLCTGVWNIYDAGNSERKHVMSMSNAM
jgi:hypothetical protein